MDKESMFKFSIIDAGYKIVPASVFPVSCRHLVPIRSVVPDRHRNKRYQAAAQRAGFSLRLLVPAFKLFSEIFQFDLPGSLRTRGEKIL